ncbi:hypothetical protein OS493_035145 [Desmophyllum pertusum]|uniref:Uncharacterized protein n=1 Tax=Desmophyllum pertusum TaxID=174260 RepID=A0A9X0CQN6_9CNID|nr:hypothetical protein OS493_035145 [Desmophyllum pertusum]
MKITQNKDVPQEQREQSGTRVTQDEKNTECKTAELEQTGTSGLVLMKDLEARRLQWVKEHTPWSTTSTAEDRSHPVAMKARPR